MWVGEKNTLFSDMEYFITFTYVGLDKTERLLLLLLLLFNLLSERISISSCWLIIKVFLYLWNYFFLIKTLNIKRNCQKMKLPLMNNKYLWSLLVQFCARSTLNIVSEQKFCQNWNQFRPRAYSLMLKTFLTSFHFFPVSALLAS